MVMNSTASSTCCDSQSPVDEYMDDWLFLPFTSVATSCHEDESRKDTEEGGKLKSKLVSVWNSVKYGWSFKQKSNLSKTAPVIMFGKSYQLTDQGENEAFHRSFATLVWLTYRRGFPQLTGCSLTTDSGWGCLLRTGQMLLARGLLLHLMPQGITCPVSHHMFNDDMDLREFRPEARPVSIQNSKDHPSAPFGIHQLVEFGKRFGKKAGDWYGPSIVAHILRKAAEASTDLSDLVIYVAQDCTIYMEDVKELCGRCLSGVSTSSIQPWKAIILLVPVRLGGQELNPAYIRCIKKLLKLKCCIGIIGGKPKHSLYFVGFQDEHLLYLDPHYCQPTVDTTKDNFPLESFHCKYPRKMLFSRMDPSCTIGFYAKGQNDFEMLRRVVDEAVSTSAETYPMFIFVEGHSRGEEEEEEESKRRTSNITYVQRKRDLQRTNTSNSMDEFVLL
ncbi:cysteine protease atg4da-like isoform X2 [Syngnathoides biaculeatus]|uniref:cysteine protease atg4da-like isoform X2 n=1 Tax=Syngnathoides biaculeatus TaxID=300417 RepID=UPI002ADDC08E|nr:cysteine protease atg4da-like isoform X2 [Syngnathoides biaculeatus]